MNKSIDPFENSSCGGGNSQQRSTLPAPVPPTKTNLDFLVDIAAEDVTGLKKAQQSYGDSWKRRGGVGAFMMLARKWDRLEVAMTTKYAGEENVPPYDIFTRTENDKRAEGLIDDIRDLRRYFLLVESELRARGTLHGKHRDNQ